MGYSKKLLQLVSDFSNVEENTNIQKSTMIRYKILKNSAILKEHQKYEILSIGSDKIC